jgi:hypothetical protein
MSQISPPIRIALVAAIAFLAVWMLALRPKDEAVEPATPAAPAGNVATGAPAESAPGKIAEQAQGAAAAAESAAAARAGEAAPAVVDGSQATTTQATPVEAGDPKAAKDSDLPLPVLKAIAKEKVLVMLFWNPRADDDRAQRRAVRGLPSHRGRVYTHVANIKNVSRYASITRGVNLAQSPTTVVVDPKLGATALVGFTSRNAVDQIVADALRIKR